MKFIIDGIEVEGNITEITPAPITDEDRAARIVRAHGVVEIVEPVRVFSIMLDFPKDDDATE